MDIKRILSFAFSLVIITLSCLCLSNSAIALSSPSRVINLVYDDSGSMIETDIVDSNGGVIKKNELVDTWCQAKYAIEVFAALLGENDTLNVYVMSSYSKPKLVLNGKNGSKTNVEKVHNMVTNAGMTPFAAVETAYKDLKNATADEKWLVVLTDGEFQGVDDIDKFFQEKDSDISVMFLGMGPQADGISADESKNIFYKEAKSNSEILKQVTDISTQIFNSDRLEINSVSKTFSFDVPMKELVVFAQGANVNIQGIKSSDGKLYESTSIPVTVKYSEKAANNYSDFIVATDLLGSIATFKDDFLSGDYTVEVTGAETIEIYYKPNVEIAAYLKDKDGNEVTDLNSLESGTYTIEFGLVKGGTDEKIEHSKLLGDVKYNALVENNGVVHEKTYKSGDKIEIAEGSLLIRASASYLKYNTVSTDLEYSVFKNKTITYAIMNNVSYVVNGDGFESNGVIELKAKIDGKDFSESQWETVGVPSVVRTDNHRFKLDDFIVEKSDELGVYRISPAFLNGKPSYGTYVDCDFDLIYEEKHGEEVWAGNGTLPVKMQDTRSWIERNWDLFVKLLILGIILFIIAGYIPGIKKYLPSKLKKRPSIIAEPHIPGNEVEYYKGTLDKSLISTIIPYIPQTGTLKFVPAGVFGVPRMQLRASTGQRMILVNTKSFEGREHILIAGQPVINGSAKIRLTAGTNLVVEDAEWTYSCQPSNDNRNN